MRKGFPSRPTTDFAKENLFNILNNTISFEDICVLDLFTGTGGISYEFASRGASEVISVDKDFRSISFIKKTIAELKFAQIKAICSDVFKYIGKCGKKFDVIFADPPYDLKNIEEIVEKVLEADILNEDGVFILEHPGNYDFSKTARLVDSRKYGSVNFSIFK